MSADEQRITRIDPDGPPIKRANGKWAAQRAYTLEDGTVVKGTYGPFSTKRDANAESQPQEVANMVAYFNEDGTFGGTRTTYSFR